MMDADSVLTSDAESVGLGCSLDHFREKDEIKSMIECLKSRSIRENSLERCFERYVYVFDQYQEQPHLVDPHLDELLLDLISVMRTSSQCPQYILTQAFKYLYVIAKVRGPKIIVRHLPHEVSDLEPVLQLLSHQDSSDTSTWEIRYFLLLWLSIIVMTPFDMSKFDNDEARQQNKTVVNRLLTLVQLYLCVGDRCADVAAMVVSRLLTRPDIKDSHLSSFVDWCLQKITKSENVQMFRVYELTGALKAMAILFKHGKREDFLIYTDPVLAVITKNELYGHVVIAIRKLTFKLIQRLGLTYLKVKVASWRYTRGNRSITLNLSSDAASKSKETNHAELTDEIVDEDDVPAQIEEIIEFLIKGLKDEATVIRWSAAKGVGRITGRLPKEFADEVVESVLSLFNLSEADCSWHGGCLALAELGRRGLLLPQRLPEVLPVILKALVYDEPRGNFSVGSHIRDAACYVCWSFARAYAPCELQSYVNSLASSLLVVSVFDREVNCRRAASAAFQENVGRQGTFPHGIDILTNVDYFAVGNRTNSYLNLSTFVAQFDEYKIPLIDHIVELKINHWDKVIREVSAEALARLTPHHVVYVKDIVLPKLINLCTGFDLNTRHGSILSLARVIHSLSTINKNNNDVSKPEIIFSLDANLLNSIMNIPSILTKKKMYRGMGGELMRQAVCIFIELMCSSAIPCDDATQEEWLNLLNDNIGHTSSQIQGLAVSTVSSFFNNFYLSHDGKLKNDRKQSEIIDYYIKKTMRSEQCVQSGFVLALGSLPKFMVSGRTKNVLDCLRNRCSDYKCQIETRRDAMTAISNFCTNVGIGEGDSCLNKMDINECYRCLLQGLDDYTVDSRGDVGAFVREASMTSLKQLTDFVVTIDPRLIVDDVCENLFIRISKQAVEKIDRVRLLAGSVFFSLLYSNPSLPFIPDVDDLKSIFVEEICREKVNWAKPADTFPLFSKLLHLPRFRYHILLGMTVSVGCLTESLIKHSSSSFFDFIISILNNRELLKYFCDDLLQMLKENFHNNLIVLPYFKMMNQLLSSGFLPSPQIDDSFFVNLTSLCRAEVQNCSDPVKLIASIDVFCGLLQYPMCRKAVWIYLSFLLCHRYPRVRKAVASNLYETLLTYDILDENVHADVFSIIGDTDWGAEVESIRPIRDNLCDLLEIPRPVRRVKK